MRHLLLATAALLLTSATANAATHFSFVTLDNASDPTFNQLLGINNAGTIAGYFGSGAAGHPNKGYTIAAPYTAFVADNLPGSVQTQATGINAANATTGFWSDTNHGGDANFGFIRWNNNGRLTYLSVNDPLVSSNPPINQLLGINKGNVAVGFYNDGNNPSNSHAFSYSVKTTAFTPVKIGGAVSAAATGINTSGQICGFFVNGLQHTVGFVKNATGGVVTHFTVPGTTFTQLLGINNHGQAVGFFQGADMVPHGLLYTPGNGAWTQVDDPNGSLGTVVNGVNDVGQLVGFYTDAAGNVHGMLVTVSH